MTCCTKNMKHADRIDAKISQLLNAIDAWREADADFALNGECDASAEEIWNKAKARMLKLADKIRAAMPDLPAPKDALRTKAVVTIEELDETPSDGYAPRMKERTVECASFDEARKVAKGEIAKMNRKFTARRPRVEDDAVYAEDGTCLALCRVRVEWSEPSPSETGGRSQSAEVSHL